MDKVIAIIGPTAVGKTSLSFFLAEKLHTELISGDAYQIYKKMNIGTAKPTAEELHRYTHHLIDIIDPSGPYSAAAFCYMAGQAIQQLNAKGAIPVLVGGTGLYVQSLLEGFHFDGPKSSEAMRERARERIARSTREDLAAYIRKNTDWQPVDWNELFCNTHRLVRLLCAIEGQEGAAFVHTDKEKEPLYDAYVIGLRLPREVLYKRINQRVDDMLANGWITEVISLLENGISADCQSMKAIGYEEITAYLNHRLTFEEMAERIKIRTRHFAKRQLTWYKRMPYIHWYEKEHYASEEELAHSVITDIETYWKWNV